MNKLRFRSGQVHLRRVPVEAATVIEAGDLVWLDGNRARPAADFAWTTDLATTQSAFAEVFLGIAHQPSAAGESSPISVDVSPDAVYEMDVSPGTFTLGQALGPDELSQGLMSQQLEAAAAAQAIARCAEFTGNSVSTVRVTLASAFHTGSGNAHAAVG